MGASLASHRRANPGVPRLIESYCPACGLLIAASPRPGVLASMERIHNCPVHGYYPRSPYAPLPVHAAESLKAGDRKRAGMKSRKSK